ncbi:MAG: pentapeptide repeat-containing protein [Actinomycetota bacterium]|nr:pentapeptide repeat-containing protein [Actinomycetota bacterium]
MAVDVGGAVSTASVVVAAAVAVLGVVGYQNRRAKLSAIRSAFTHVIGLLAAQDAERRLAGAIFLRRFLDPSSEFGIRDGLFRRRAPYAREAQNVMAAVLRGVPRGNLQKLLADGLAHAKTLDEEDLQRTNLQDAYLGEGGPLKPKGHGGSLKGADFYRADLSEASLRGVKAQGAKFYQARLQGTVLRDAELQGATFFEADLFGANFKGALLHGASFAGARNIPEELMPYLANEETKFDSKDPAPAPAKPAAKRPHVFLSAPSERNPAQVSVCERLAELFAREGLLLEALPRHDYPPSSALAEIARRLDGCAGMVVLGLRHSGADPAGASAGTTPWTHVEAGMAYGKGLPLLLLREPGVSTGVFDHAVDGHHTHVVDLEDRWSEESMRSALRPWIFEVSKSLDPDRPNDAGLLEAD